MAWDITNKSRTVFIKPCGGGAIVDLPVELKSEIGAEAEERRRIGTNARPIGQQSSDHFFLLNFSLCLLTCRQIQRRTSRFNSR
jgi:hypothetical protein